MLDVKVAVEDGAPETAVRDSLEVLHTVPPSGRVGLDESSQQRLASAFC